jgi:O-antigen ligase
VLTFGVVASLVVAAATWWRRIAGLLLVLAALPWALHHPSTPRTMVLAGVVGALQVAYLLRVAVDRRRGQILQAGSSPLMWVTGVWGVAGLLSLFNLPWASMMVTVREYYAAVPGRTWRDVWVAWWTVPDNFPHFSVVGAFLTVQAALLAWMVWREVRQSPDAGVQVAMAQLLGLTVAVGLGLLESTGVDLTPLRGSEMVHLAPGSIQSVAGNRGWFAQYLTFGLPYALVMTVIWPLRHVRALVFVLCVCALICLAFAFQRGGWAAGLLAVGCIAAVMSAAPIDSAPAARRVLRRSGGILLVTALSGTLAFAAVRLLVPPSKDGDNNPHVLGERLSAAGYISRLQGTDIVGGRERYWPVAWDFWRQHPIIGGGIEGFAHLHRTEVEEPTGSLRGRRPPVPMANSAHNIYLQTAVGTGALGLLALLAMFGLGMRAMVRTVTSERSPIARRMVALSAGGSLLAIMVYGLVQEVTYIHALRLMLCCAVGLLAAGVPADERGT